MPYSLIASGVVFLSGEPNVYFPFFFLLLTIDSANEKNFKLQKK